jgi:hypothetical protein
MHTYGWGTTKSLIEAGAKISYHHRIETDPLWWLCYAFAGSLGIWWLLAFAGRRHGGRLWWLLVPVFAQFLVGGDWSRFALYAFPVVVPVAAIAVWQHPRRILLLALITAQSLTVLADLTIAGRLGINAMWPSTYATIPLMALTAAVLCWPPRRVKLSTMDDGPAIAQPG